MNVSSRIPPLNLLKTTKKVPPHSRTAKAHFFRRFEERLGYKLTEAKFLEIKRLVKKGGSKIKNGDGLNSVWEINLDGMKVKVVYNAFKDYLVTIF